LIGEREGEGRGGGIFLNLILRVGVGITPGREVGIRRGGIHVKTTDVGFSLVISPSRPIVGGLVHVEAMIGTEMLLPVVVDRKNQC